MAIPALGALIAEPLYILADTAVVGHLGPDPLAGLAVASSILLILYSLFIFLAYGTTASVADSSVPATSAKPLTKRCKACGSPSWSAWSCAIAVTSFSGPLVGLLGATGDGARAGAHLPADQSVRCAGHAARPGRHRLSTRPAGHAHAVVRRGRFRRVQPRARVVADLRPRLRDRRVGPVDGDRAVGRRGGLRRVGRSSGARTTRSRSDPAPGNAPPDRRGRPRPVHPYRRAPRRVPGRDGRGRRASARSTSQPIRSPSRSGTSPRSTLDAIAIAGQALDRSPARRVGGRRRTRRRPADAAVGRRVGQSASVRRDLVDAQRTAGDLHQRPARSRPDRVPLGLRRHHAADQRRGVRARRAA